MDRHGQRAYHDGDERHRERDGERRRRRDPDVERGGCADRTRKLDVSIAYERQQERHDRVPGRQPEHRRAGPAGEE
jgi:hypothetical protein